MKTGGCCLPSHFGGPKAEYFAGRGFGFRWACVRSCRRERRGELRQFVPSGAQKIKSAQGAPYFLVELKQNTSREGRFGFRWACVRSYRRERRGELRQLVLADPQKIKSAQGAPYFLVDLKQNTSREGRYCFIRAHIRSCRRKRRGELRQFVPSGAQNENGRLLPPVSFWWTCAEYFAGEAFRFQMGSHSLVPPRAAGRTEAVRSVRRAKNKERKGAPYFLVDLRRIELRSYKVPPRILHA